MTRYFFNTKDGRAFRDPEGLELADGRAAQIEAIRFLGELLKDGAQDFLGSPSLTVTVVDVHGRTRYALAATVVVAWDDTA